MDLVYNLFPTVIIGHLSESAITQPVGGYFMEGFYSVDDAVDVFEIQKTGHPIKRSFYEICHQSRIDI